MQTRLLVVAALHPKFLFVVEGSSNYIVVSSFFYFHPEDWGNDPIWRFAYFSMWLVQPPTGNLVDIEKKPDDFEVQSSSFPSGKCQLLPPPDGGRDGSWDEGSWRWNLTKNWNDLGVCFQKLGYSKMDGLQWKTLLKWNIFAPESQGLEDEFPFGKGSW